MWPQRLERSKPGSLIAISRLRFHAGSRAAPSISDRYQSAPIPIEPILKTIAIIGAGPLGRWLALSAARAGYRVLLEDVMPANLHHAEEYLRQELGAVALVSGPLPVEFVSTVEDAVRQADLAIDCVPDELESKLEILWLLDRMAPPRTVLAKPTTLLSIADLARCTDPTHRCVA